MSLLARLQSYSEPLILLSMSVAFLPLTLISHPLLLVQSPSTFRAKWFEKFWMYLGPKMAAAPVQVEEIEKLLSRAHGTVLEFGPGSGDQMYHYKAEQITHAYAAEPNGFLHSKLLEQAEEAGIGRKYTALEAGAQPDSLLPALQSAGLIPASSTTLPSEGVFDSIIAIKSLCSAPQNDLPSTIAIAQALLKPGGEFLFFEHLANVSDPVTQTYAWVLDLIWPRFMGNCRLDGKLDKVVGGMGGWASRDLHTVGEHRGFEVFRYVTGVCRKA